MDDTINNGGETDYYALPKSSKTLQDLIEYKNMNFAIGNIFKASYRIKGNDAEKIYDLNKIIWFATREKDRIMRKNIGVEEINNLDSSKTKYGKDCQFFPKGGTKDCNVTCNNDTRKICEEYNKLVYLSKLKNRCPYNYIFGTCDHQECTNKCEVYNKCCEVYNKCYELWRFNQNNGNDC